MWLMYIVSSCLLIMMNDIELILNSSSCIFRLVNAQQSKNRQGQIHTSNPEAIPVHFRSYPSPDA